MLMIYMKKVDLMTNRAIRAFTLIEIMIVVAIIGIIIAIAVPAFIRARENARGRACQENLSKLEGAKSAYATETKAIVGDTVPVLQLWNTDGTGYLKSEPKCPSDRQAYVINVLGTSPTCPNYDAASNFTKHSVAD